MKKSWFLPLFFLLTLCIKSVYSQSPILSDYIEFDGSTGYVEIPGDTSNDFGANDAFTFEAWIKISSGPSNNGDKSHIFGRTWSEFYLLNDNGNIKLQGRYRVEYYGNWPIVTSSSSLSLDTWYHVAYSYSKVNGNLSIHINGQLDGNTSSSSFITGGGNSIGLGARIDNYGTSVSGFFNGSIDEARIWNVQRTAEEINSNKSLTQSQNSNLVLYYKLDDGLGSSVIDSSGNNLTGIASGTYQWSRPTVTLTDTDSDNLVSNSDVVTITATFSESMAATPTLSLSGITSDALMSATATASIWTYAWTVSTTVASTTATVSATDLSGNAYSGADSITFTILSKSFTKTESGSFLKVLKTANGKYLASKLSDNNASSGYNFIYESTDLQNWSQLSLSFDTSVSRGSWYGFHKDTNSVLYLATKDNGVYKSSDGSSWANTISGDIGGTGAIDITSTSSYTFLLMTGNIRGIYSSNDQTNWTKIKSDGLDMADLAVGNDNTVYSITTTKKLFESQNANTTTTNVVWSENTIAAFNSKTVVVENLNDKIHLINDEGKVYRNDSGTWNNISTIPFTTTEQAYLNQLIQTSSTTFWLGTVYNGVWYSSDSGSNWINYSNVYSGTYQGIFAENDVIVITTTEGIYSSGTSDTVTPTVTLTDTDSDNIVSNSDVVTITATFSESMSATPTISLTGIVSDVQMSATASDSIWTYAWTVSGSNVTSTTATVSGTDLSGNAYSGTDSITFTIDNSNPSLTIIRPKGTYTNQSVVVTLTYDEAVTGLTTDTSQFSEATNIASLTLLSVSSDYKTYTVRITPSSDGLVKLTHAPNSPPVTDSAGNPIASTVSCSFIYDATSPNVTLTDSDSDNIVVNSDVVTITVVFDELVSNPSLMLYDSSSSLLSSNTLTVSDSLIFSNYWRKKLDGSYENPENDGGNENYAYMGYIQNTSHYQNGLITFVDYRSGQDALHYIIETPSILSSIQSHTYIGTFQDSNYFTSNVKTSNIEQTISNLNGLGYRLLTIETNSEYNYFKTLYSSSQILNDNNPYWIGLIQNTSSSNYSEPSGGWEWIKLEAKQWEYSLTISTTLPSITAKVSATDLAGNAYTGTDSITFTTDNSNPTVTLTDTDADNLVSNSNVVTITATFSESMSAVPTLSLNGIASNLNMSKNYGINLQDSSLWNANEPNNSNSGTEAYGMLQFYGNALNDTTPGHSTKYVLEFNSTLINSISGFTYLGEYNNHNYFYSNSSFTWENANQDAINNGGYLAVINEKSELDFLKSFSYSGANIGVFLGFYQDTTDPNYSEPDGGWKWVDDSSSWTYTWTVSGLTVTSTIATVSGTDLAGNAYTGTDSITFTIDNSNPTLVSFTDNDTDNYVNNYTNITFSATFSESMATSPTLSISGLVTNTSMTISAYTNSTTWTYLWDVPSGSDGIYFATVSGTDLLGNAYSGTESITFVIDNTDPLIQSITVTDTNSKVLLTYNEPIQLYDPSYFATNFSVTKTGGTATVSYTGYSFSTTDSNTIILNITVTGEPTGDELLEVGPAGASTLIDRAGNYALAYSDSSQTSNTVYLTNTPPKFTSTAVSSNNTSITIVFSEGVTADASGTELSKTDFTLVVSGGTAVLSSATPTALSKTDSKTYVLSTSYSTPANGSEILTVTPISSVLYDSKGTQIVMSASQSNTVQLNDQAGPSITGATIDSQNRYVDITFSEGVYSSASPATAVTSSSFTLSQSSGPSYGMTISSITTTAGANLSGGETSLRFNLGSTVKPTGQEVFAITATDSSSVVDVSGNSMTVSQTNNTFQLKPPTSGGVSPEKSTISAAPAEMIGNGINTAVITVQAKDSLGQNFLEGGYQITLFGPAGDLTTTDNQNGTYSASYTPDAITQDFQELTFGFRVAGTNGSNTALLRLYLDEDGDGVYNINDACLGTEAGLEVDATGCALNQLDSDNDGIFDDLDECPDTPEFEINNIQGTPTYGELIPTVVDEKGCGASQRDTDGDGIVDTEDNCIDTANSDQADKDADGIGDVCDTDNPLPEITTTEIKFVQLPQNGTTVGIIEATDTDGETLTFTQSGDNFTGVLSVASDGSVTVSSGALLTFDSAYNGASLGFTVSDGENDVPGSVKILIEDVPRPPEISIITLEISEDAEIGTIVGFVEAIDPMGGQIASISLQGDGFIELEDGVLKTTQELDYETTTAHPFTITAQASNRTDGPGLSGSKSESISVADIPNATYTGRFFISIFNVDDEALGAKVDHTRYFNPHNKNVGKWKVKKKIKGGADADKFTIKSRSKTEQKNGNPVDEETEDYLDFITPPDFENPGDANRDNIYEVEIEYINTDDGAPEVPIVVTQTNIQVPEGKSRTIELQAQPVLPTDDNDGDGVVDILDNSPLVANPDQSDEDGDGVGDVTDDFDHDGVWNPFDTCPDTPLGELVDLDGCLIYYLPASNFSISKTEKCVGENSITINVIDATVDYNVTVSGATNAAEVFTGSSWSLENLSAGEYTLCIGVEGVNPLEFERCFKVTIEESDPLLVSSLYNKENQTVSFDLSGGSAYQITHNGKTTQTSSSKHTVQLDKGINNISISTGIECQGLFENTYLNSYEVKYAPNPFKDELQLFIGGKDNLVEIGVYSSNGQLIDYQTVSLSFGMRNYSLNTSSYKQGVYIIKIKGHTLDQSIQVIKE